MLVLFALEKSGVTNFINGPATEGPTPAQKEQDTSASAAKKKALIEDTNSKADPYSSSDGSEVNKRVEVSAAQEANNTVTVFTKLYGYSDGSCLLTVTNGTKTTTQTAAAMYQSEFSSCAGFSVPIGPLGKGTWSIKLSVTSADKTQDKSISFEVK